jgi:hypothetical protein
MGAIIRFRNFPLGAVGSRRNKTEKLQLVNVRFAPENGDRSRGAHDPKNVRQLERVEFAADISARNKSQLDRLNYCWPQRVATMKKQINIT